MKLSGALVLSAASLALALGGCSDDAPPGPNPGRLWLTLDGSEVQVKLSPIEPGYF